MYLSLLNSRPLRAVLFSSVAAVISLGWIISLSAQEPTPTPAASPTPTLVERTIYTPYEKLESVFEHEGRGVFLPYREFLDLWNKLNLPVDVKQSAPPVDGVLASARYTGRIEGDAAVFVAQLHLEALKEGWSKVALGGRDLSIAEVKSAVGPTVAGQAVTPTLHLAPSGYEAILPAKGGYTVDLSVLGKVVHDAGRSTLQLHLPRTAASQFELTIADTGLEFTLTPASAFTAKEENGGTRLAAFFGSSEEVSISWRKKSTETTLPALVFAESTLETSVGPGALRTTANIDLRILRSAVGTFRLLVPAGTQVLAVEAADLREWDLAPAAADGRQQIVVNLAAPAHEHSRLRVMLEAPVTALPARLTVPAVEVAGAEGQSGTITLTADPTLTVAIDPRQGVTQMGSVEPNAPASTATTPSVFLGAFRFLRLPYALDLGLRAAEPVVEVASAALLTVEPETTRLRAQLNYTVKRAGLFTAAVDLPAGFVNVEARGAMVEGSSTSAGAEPGMQRLEIHFKARQTGAFTFEVIGDLPRAKPDEPVAVAGLRPVGAARHDGQVAVAIHQSLDPVTSGTGDLRQEDVGTLTVPAPERPDLTPLTLGFRYRGEAVKPAQLAFTLRRPRVSADVQSLVDLRESLVVYRWRIAYHVEYAGVDELVLDAPPGIAADLQFDGAGVKEKVAEDEKDAAGKTTGHRIWRIRLQQKKLGDYVLNVNAERALPPPASGQTHTVDWPELKTVGLFRETGQIAVVKEGNLEITHPGPQGLELIDPKELTMPVALQPRGVGGATAATDIFLAYKYTAHPAALKLEFSKNQYLPVPTALVTYAVINTVVTADRAETTEAIYWVRNNGRQFLSVALPARGQMLSDVFVNGQPQQPSRRPDQSALLIRLPAHVAETSGASPANANASPTNDAAADSPISVRLVYAVPAEQMKRGDLGWFGHLHVAPCVLEEARVLQTQYSLYLPSGYRYVNFSGPMREAYGDRGWNRFRGVLDFLVPSLGPEGDWEPSARWEEPPVLTPAAGGGFDSPLPKEGTPVILRRLDVPAPVDVSYRALGYANTLEAAAFLLAFSFGISLLGATRGARLAYFFLVGCGALILTGAVLPRAGGHWTAVYLGVFLAAVVWMATGTIRWLRRLAFAMAERWRQVFAWTGRRTRPTAVPPAPKDPPPPVFPPQDAGPSATAG